MAKRKYAIIAILLCCCFYLLPIYAQASSTADAAAPIDPETICSLSLSYQYDGTPFGNVPVSLYKIADVSSDFQYTLTPLFASSGLILNGIQTSSEWNVIRYTLEAHILAQSIAPTVVSKTDIDGNVHFETLKTGLYLAIVGQVVQEDLRCYFDSALVSLPGLDVYGQWQYQVSAAAKGEALPPEDTDQELQFKVLKLWKGDENRTDRPVSIEVEIFCNGSSYQTVVLSEENNWSFAWTAKDDGSTWMVVERNIPDGYTMQLEERGTSFILTNVRKSDTPDTPKPPTTGDTSRVLLYLIMMILSGSVLMIIGIIRKESNYEEAKSPNHS